MDRDEVNRLIDQKIQPLLDRIQKLELELKISKDKGESIRGKFIDLLNEENDSENRLREQYGYVEYPSKTHSYVDADGKFTTFY